MPQVGNKRFPYNAKGIAAAKASAKKTGQKMVITDSAAEEKTEKKPAKKAPAKKTVPVRKKK